MQGVASPARFTCVPRDSQRNKGSPFVGDAESSFPSFPPPFHSILYSLRTILSPQFPRLNLETCSGRPEGMKEARVPTERDKTKPRKMHLFRIVVIIRRGLKRNRNSMHPFDGFTKGIYAPSFQHSDFYSIRSPCMKPRECQFILDRSQFSEFPLFRVSSSESV